MSRLANTCLYVMTCHVFGDVLHVRSRLEFNDFPFMSSAARRRDSEEIPFDGGML